MGADLARSPKTSGRGSAAKTGKARSTKTRHFAKTKDPVQHPALLKPSVASEIELKEAREQQAATADILKVIARSPHDVQPVFEAIGESANRLVGAHGTTVLRIVGDMVELAAFTPVGKEADAVLQSSFPLPIAGNPHYEKLRRGEIAEAADTEAAHSVLRNIARARGYRSRLLVPLKDDSGVIGAISVTRKEPGAFAAHHVQLLQTFADQAVIAIRNVRLFNETQEALERQTATADVLKVISRSSVDLGSVLQTLVQTIARLCRADQVYMFHLRHDLWHLVADCGLSAEARDFFRDNPFTPGRGATSGRAALERRAVHIPDVLQDPEYILGKGQEVAGYRTTLGIPLLREDTLIGVYSLARTRVEPFTDKEIELATSFADQAVIAIENVRLFNETREALERQTATADILKVIASSPSDVQPVFDAIATRSKQLVGGLTSAVYSIADEMLHLKAFTPTTPEADAFLQASFPRPLSSFFWAEQTLAGEIVEFSDVETEWVGQPDALSMARSRGFRSLVFIPLRHYQTVIGVILVTRAEPGRFAFNHLQLLETFADQAVIAIENVRLFDEVQAKTRELEESLLQQTATADVLKAISRSAFDLPTVLQTLVESAARLCDADKATITRQRGGEFYRGEFVGFSQDFIDFVRDVPVTPDPGSAIGRTLLEGAIIHIPDVTADPDYTFAEAQRLGEFRTMLGVPMQREDKTIGVFALTRSAVRPFTDKQIELATTFADQAAIAIENARLFEEVQQRTQALTRSLEDLRTAQDRLVQTEKLASLGQLTAGIAHEIKNPLNFVNNFSALSAELTGELIEVLKPVALDGKVRDEVDELTGMLKDNLEKVVNHGKRADSIVKNMLLHSREGSGEQRSADINSLVEESLNLAYHGARAEKSAFNITLQRDLDAGAGSAELFPQEITRALLNLISNGFYAATKRKNETGQAEFEPTLLATTRNLGNAVEVRIRDNGTGIPPDVKEKMFNPFFTTKPAGEGTGLGLSMTHDIIVKQHGGRIDVETEPGKFTEFTIVLPRSGAKQ